MTTLPRRIGTVAAGCLLCMAINMLPKLGISADWCVNVGFISGSFWMWLWIVVCVAHPRRTQGAVDGTD
jgi:hypothetical protein